MNSDQFDQTVAEILFECPADGTFVVAFPDDSGKRGQIVSRRAGLVPLTSLTDHVNAGAELWLARTTVDDHIELAAVFDWNTADRDTLFTAAEATAIGLAGGDPDITRAFLDLDASMTATLLEHALLAIGDPDTKRYARVLQQAVAVRKALGKARAQAVLTRIDRARDDRGQMRIDHLDSDDLLPLDTPYGEILWAAFEAHAGASPQAALHLMFGRDTNNVEVFTETLSPMLQGVQQSFGFTAEMFEHMQTAWLPEIAMDSFYTDRAIDTLRRMTETDRQRLVLEAVDRMSSRSWDKAAFCVRQDVEFDVRAAQFAQITDPFVVELLTTSGLASMDHIR